MAERPTCETCPWLDTSTQSGMPQVEPDTTAMCRRNPPAHDDRTGLAVWPMVERDGDWCGEHPDFPTYIAAIRQPAAPPTARGNGGVG
jgi:hypothetical protein